MRHRRTPEPGAQSPADHRSRTTRGGPYELPPWAADSANDNGRSSRTQLPAVQASWEDDATTLYRRSEVGLRSLPRTHPRQSTLPLPPAPRRAAASGEQRSAARVAPANENRVSSPDDLRFGIEGSLARSLRPEQPAAPRGSAWRALPGLLVLGVCAFFSVRGLQWSVPLPFGRELVPLSAAPELQLRSPAQRGAALTDPAAVRGDAVRAPAIEPTPGMAAAPAGIQAPAPAESFTLAEAAAAESGSSSARQHAAALRKSHVRRGHAQAGLARNIQPLREPPEEEAEESEAPPARAEEGVLQVNSRPWARVLIDGRFVGHTPQFGLRVPAGRHRILLVNEQMDMSKSFDVNIHAGQTVTRVELLEERPDMND